MPSLDGLLSRSYWLPLPVRGRRVRKGLCKGLEDDVAKAFRKGDMAVASSREKGRVEELIDKALRAETLFEANVWRIGKLQDLESCDTVDCLRP